MNNTKLLVAGIALLLVVTVSVIVSIDGGDSTPSPLQALEMPDLVAVYDEGFWVEQQTADPTLWNQAIAFCDGRPVGRYPNCRPILRWLLIERTGNRQRSTSPRIDPRLDFSEREQQARERLRQLGTPDTSGRP